MNWINEFQQGGVAQSNEQAQMDEQLNILAGAMLLLQQLSAAAEQGDPDSKAILEQIQQRAQAMAQQSGAQMAKCGAKLKKKEEGGTVAAKCGKKLALGSKLPKAGCGCKTAQLKRVGGKLVTVDCNGNIIK